MHVMAPAVIVVSRAFAFEIELGILGDQPSIIRWPLALISKKAGSSCRVIRMLGMMVWTMRGSLLHVQEHLGT